MKNQDYFKDIDSQIKAYILGFIAADGCIVQNKKKGSYSLQLTLKNDDIEIIELIKDQIYPQAKTQLKTIKGKKYSGFAIYSKTIFNDLIRLGITVRKSHTIKPWDGPQHLIRHYWRGVFDGDGCFCLKPSSKDKQRLVWTSSLVGSKFMCAGFSKFIEKHKIYKDMKKKSVKNHQSVFTVSFGGRKPSKNVANALYENACIYLKRKHNLAMKILQQKIPQTIISHMTKENLMPYYNRLGNWSKVASQLGVSHNGLYKHIRKIGLTRKDTGPNGPRQSSTI